jgi:hypothetical protein
MDPLRKLATYQSFNDVIKGETTAVVNTTSLFAQLTMDISLHREWLSPSWLRLGG